MLWQFTLRSKTKACFHALINLSVCNEKKMSKDRSQINPVLQYPDSSTLSVFCLFTKVIFFVLTQQPRPGYFNPKIGKFLFLFIFIYIFGRVKSRIFILILVQFLSLKPMVFILDGCSFHYAHTWSKSGFSIC